MIARPDLAFASTAARVPVAGLVLIDAQPEYRERAKHIEANAALRRLAARCDIAVVPIDTRLDTDDGALTSAAQIESLIAKMDIVLTTRLHGTVLALKNGVPVLAIDSVAGGGKVTRQCLAVGWPIVFGAEDCTDHSLRTALDYCRSADAGAAARACADRAADYLRNVRGDFLAGFGGEKGSAR